MGKIRNGLIKTGIVVGLVGTAISIGGLVKTSYDAGKLSVEVETMENKRLAYVEQISSMNEYKAYLNRKLDESYNAYKAGEISKQQFDKAANQYLEKDDQEGLVKEMNVGEFLTENNSSSVFFNIGLEEGKHRDELARKSLGIGALSVMSAAWATALGASLNAKAKSRDEENFKSCEEIELEQ